MSILKKEKEKRKQKNIKITLGSDKKYRLKKII